MPEWEVKFDAHAFIARYPQYFRQKDDRLWADWAEEVGFDRQELNNLIGRDDIPIFFVPGPC